MSNAAAKLRTKSLQTIQVGSLLNPGIKRWRSEGKYLSLLCGQHPTKGRVCKGYWTGNNEEFAPLRRPFPQSWWLPEGVHPGEDKCIQAWLKPKWQSGILWLQRGQLYCIRLCWHLTSVMERVAFWRLCHSQISRGQSGTKLSSNKSRLLPLLWGRTHTRGTVDGTSCQ